MARDKKKRRRGSRTHGGGTQKNDRGAGNRGGRGDAGRKKHERGLHPNVGKSGFKRPQKVVEEVETINVSDLDRKILQLVDEGVAEETEDGYEIDVSDLGVEKVLGGGQVRNELKVHAEDFSDSAVVKIEDAGGEVVETDDSEDTEEETQNENTEE